jgi:hypothetical protein
MSNCTAKTTAEWGGIEDAAGLLAVRIAAWHDFGYATPPAPHCKPIPPLAECSAEAIKAGHGAIEVIDEIVRDLHVLRGQRAPVQQRRVGPWPANRAFRTPPPDITPAVGRAAVLRWPVGT